MEIVQFPAKNQPSSKLSLPPLLRASGQQDMRSKVFKLVGTLFLSSLSLNLAASPTVAQLPSLEAVPVPTTAQWENSSESTVALETYTLGPGDQIRVDVLVNHPLFLEPIDQII